MPRRNPRVNFTREPQWDYVPESGCVVTDEMRQILARPGFLNDQNGGKQLQYLYSNQSMGFSLQDFSPFGQACFLGITQVVEEAVSSGTAPPLSTKESAFEQGYATLIILGAQRIQAGRGPPSHHHAVLKFLISQSLPLDLPDVVGFTALQHAMHGTPAMLDKEALIRELLESGASINHQNRWGSTALHQAVLRGDTLGIELLMEYGADVNIPDGNGYTVKGFYVNAGAGVNAVMEKWLLKRAGEQAPLAEKRCDKCGVTTKSLKMCAACHTVQYCSKECQKSAWSGHKQMCKAYSSVEPVTLIPYYLSGQGPSMNIPVEHVQRGLLGGMPTPDVPLSQLRNSQPPKKLPAGGKQVIVKIQISPTPLTSRRYVPMHVYTQKHDFACYLRREDCPEEWDRVYAVIKNRTLSGLKGYFVADIKSRDEFVVKISEPLAAQPW